MKNIQLESRVQFYHEYIYNTIIFKFAKQKVISRIERKYKIYQIFNNLSFRIRINCTFNIIYMSNYKLLKSRRFIELENFNYFVCKKWK